MGCIYITPKKCMRGKESDRCSVSMGTPYLVQIMCIQYAKISILLDTQ